MTEAGPLPVPEGVPTVNQVALLTAVHAQALFDAVTVVDAVPPAAATFWPAGAIEYAQVFAACVTVNVCPAMVAVPIRCASVEFAAMLYPTLAPPLPDVGPVSVIQDALLTADHAQPLASVSVTVPVVADCETDRLVGEIAGVQVGEKTNVLETVLAVVPPGPIADTRAS